MAKINAEGVPSDVTAEYAEGNVYLDTDASVPDEAPQPVDEPVEEKQPAVKVAPKTGK